MEGAASLACPKVTPFTSAVSPTSYLISVRPFNKHLQCNNLSLKNSLAENNSRLVRTSSNCFPSVFSNCGNPFSSASVFSSFSDSNSRTVRPFRKLKCSYSSSSVPAESDAPNPLLKSLKEIFQRNLSLSDASNQLLKSMKEIWQRNPSLLDAANPLLKSLKDFSFESVKSALLQLTPVDICKWCLVFSIAIAIPKWTVNMLLNPFFWMYFSWTWVFWPWMVAIGVAIYGAYSLYEYSKGEASLLEQLSIVTSAFTWLTLVPPAHFNGFLEGWPFVFFFVYHYFFFLSISVRKRLYGDYYPRGHDTKWDISLPNWQKLLFCVGVMVGHWLAGFEGPELHLVPGGWNNVSIWILIMLTVFIQYQSTLYLAKYSEKVVVPTAVVQFGPYRFVRHPIYASTMLLFVTYFTALRAPVSALFIVAVCLMYYGQKTNLEEALMLETFGEKYSEYMSKVRYRLIPFVY